MYRQVQVLGWILLANLSIAQSSVNVGDFVWNDLNGNGIQNVGEPGLPGVLVSASDGTTNFSTTTDASGLWNLLLPPGTYIVTFDAADGYHSTISNAGNNENLDSDIQAGLNIGKTESILVRPGVDIMSIDAGFFAVGQESTNIGNLVWNDLNGNGIQDAGEPGLAGVFVSTSDGTTNFFTMTDASGL